MSKKINNKRILLLEQDVEFRNSLTRVLMRGAFDVFQAGTFDEALDYLKNMHPMLMLFGFEKPTSENLYKVRTLIERFDKMPIVLITTFEQTELSEDIKNREHIHILNKPVKKDHLIRTLEKLTLQQFT